MTINLPTDQFPENFFSEMKVDKMIMYYDGPKSYFGSYDDKDYWFYWMDWEKPFEYFAVVPLTKEQKELMLKNQLGALQVFRDVGSYYKVGMSDKPDTIEVVESTEENLSFGSDWMLDE